MVFLKLLFKLVDLFIIILLLYFIKDFIYIITLSSLIYFIMNITVSYLKKNRLNFLYTFIKNKDGYELQYNPPLGFHWIVKKDLLKYRQEAISKLIQLYNADCIYGRTMTLHSMNENYKNIYTYSFKEKWLNITPTIMLTIINLSNLFTLTLTRKVYKMIFINSFSKYIYYQKETPKR